MSAIDSVNEAFAQVGVVRAIISSERSRAIAEPLNKRNSDLGILKAEGYKTRADAEREIIAIFNSLELLLDHFNILHMAASFEQAAGIRIDNALGLARNAIERGKKPGERWAARLLRETKSYQSLESIGELLKLSADDDASFKAIRRVRNELGHGVPIRTVPAISGDDARIVLVEALERLKV